MFLSTIPLILFYQSVLLWVRTATGISTKPPSGWLAPPAKASVDNLNDFLNTAAQSCQSINLDYFCPSDTCQCVVEQCIFDAPAVCAASTVGHLTRLHMRRDAHLANRSPFTVMLRTQLAGV